MKFDILTEKRRLWF